jgi:hypothetical protein
MGLAAVSGAAAFLVGRFLPSDDTRAGAAIHATLAGGTCAVVYLAGVWWIAPAVWSDLIGRLRRQAPVGRE